MRRLLLSTAALIALGATAHAADMAVRKAPPPIAPLPMVYNWTGFYIGINGGWGSSHNC